MYKSILFGATALCLCVLSGCSEAKCWNNFGIKCEDFNGSPSRCHSDSTKFQYLPNCDLVEYCTDYSAIETESSNDADSVDSEAVADSDSLVESNSDTVTDSDSESTAPTGIVCKYRCEGKLVPCDSFSSESQCTRAAHCEWYDNSVD